MPVLNWTYPGEVSYRQALRLQYGHARRVARGAGPMLFMMQHPPTITLGRHADESSLRLTRAEYASRGFEVFRIKRGGDVTYHGPGQLVGYPVASLDSVPCSVPAWVQGHARALVAYLEQLGVDASWSDRRPGVWVDGKKVAALGFHISRRVSTHGFALNVNPDLSHFDTIVPCGLKNTQVTSLQRLVERPPDLADVARTLARLVAEAFGWSPGDRIPSGQLFEEPTDAQTMQALGS